jgi:NAD(P)-dependent dehydrogenase (short-subunit alcohol dehydrogenase family)
VAAFDVTSQDDADAAVAAGVERFGRIDVVANSAGGVVQGLLRG